MLGDSLGVLDCFFPSILVAAVGAHITRAPSEVAEVAFLGYDPGDGQDALPSVTA